MAKYFKMKHHKDEGYFKIVEFIEGVNDLDSMKAKYEQVNSNGTPYVEKPKPKKKAGRPKKEE